MILFSFISFMVFFFYILEDHKRLGPNIHSPSLLQPMLAGEGECRVWVILGLSVTNHLLTLDL